MPAHLIRPLHAIRMASSHEHSYSCQRIPSLPSASIQRKQESESSSLLTTNSGGSQCSTTTSLSTTSSEAQSISVNTTTKKIRSIKSTPITSSSPSAGSEAEKKGQRNGCTNVDWSYQNVAAAKSKYGRQGLVGGTGRGSCGMM